MKPLPPPLLALSPGTLRPGDEAELLERASAAFGGGLRGLLVREPGLPDGALVALVRGVLELAPRDAWVGVHDRVHVALALDLPGVHLGFRSLPVERVRAWLDGHGGEPPRVGLSTHAGDDPAGWRPADYLLHGPVRPTPSKEGLVEPVGFDGLARAVAASARPVWALGGLRPRDVAACRAAGAAGVAVLGGVLRAEDPESAAAAYLEAFEG